MNKIYVILSLFLFIACNDDKGNYDYDAINEVLVKLDEEIGIRLQDTVLEIRPELSQSLLQNEENLEFIWLHSIVNTNIENDDKRDTIGYEKSIKWKIDPAEKNFKYGHYFRFIVKDKATGIDYRYNTTLKIVKPYHGAWMVLHKQDGVTKLGSVEYIGRNMEVCNDAYYRESGKHLQGNPLCLGVEYGFLQAYGTGDNNLFLVVTDVPNEAGIYCQWEKFRKVDSMSRMVAPSYRSSFNYQDVKNFDGVSNNYGNILISEGTLYQSPTAMKWYRAHVDEAVTGTVDLSCGTKVGFASMFYDKAGKRFLFYYAPNRNSDWHSNLFPEDKDNPAQYKLSLIPTRDLNITTTDPNKLSADKEVLYVGTGYNYDASMNNQMMCYGFAQSVEKDSCYVYEFRSYGLGNSSQAAFSGFYPIKTPENLDAESCFASSKPYNGILFYAAGDKVYRLDFIQTGGKATPIYTHPGGKAKIMKFAFKDKWDDKLDYSAYEHDLNRSLGVVFEMPDGTSELVILNLATTGKVGDDGEVWPAIQVHKGFGDVKDILFL